MGHEGVAVTWYDAASGEIINDDQLIVHVDTGRATVERHEGDELRLNWGNGVIAEYVRCADSTLMPLAAESR